MSGVEVIAEIEDGVVEAGALWQPVLGAEGLALLDTLKVDTESRENLVSEAISVLARCVPPTGPSEQSTGLVIGYVGSARDLGKLVLQTRASGIRAKRPVSAPSLVAMTSSQVPIIPWENRYMTPRECARLQSMEDLQLPGSPTRAYEALGNAVNARIVEHVAMQLLGKHRREMTARADRAMHQTSFIGPSSSDDSDIPSSSTVGTLAMTT